MKGSATNDVGGDATSCRENSGLFVGSRGVVEKGELPETISIDQEGFVSIGVGVSLEAQDESATERIVEITTDRSAARRVGIAA